MTVRYLFDSSGQWIAFAKGKYVYDTRGGWIGWIPWGDNDVVTKTGKYLSIKTMARMSSSEPL